MLTLSSLPLWDMDAENFNEIELRHHPFSTYAKYSEKLTFLLTPVCVLGGKNSFLKKFAYVIRYRLRLSLLILSKIINFYFLWNNQNTCCFLMNSGRIHLNSLNIRSEIWRPSLNVWSLREHSFNTFAKFSEKLTILTRAYLEARYVSFAEDSANILNEWSLKKTWA